MMSGEIPEADWKAFRELRDVALERFCERALAEVVKVAAVYRLIEKRDKELAAAFDDFRRSTAVRQIAIIQSQGCGPRKSWRGFRKTQEWRSIVGWYQEMRRVGAAVKRKNSTFCSV